MLSLLCVSALTSMHAYWKNHSFDWMDLCWQVISQLFNMLSRFVITFFVFPHKGQVSFNFMAAVTICCDFGAQENKVCYCFHCFSIYFSWSDGTRCHDLNFLMLSFKPAFSLSSFTFIKSLFSSSLLSATMEVSSTYLRLLIFSEWQLNFFLVYFWKYP